MKEINLKMITKTIDCETKTINSSISIEQGTLEIEIVIPKKNRKKIEKLLVEEIKSLL